MPVLLYGTEAIVLREKGGSWIGDVQTDKFRGLLGIMGVYKVPKSRKRELCGVT